jgi:hypothetical protein
MRIGMRKLALGFVFGALAFGSVTALAKDEKGAKTKIVIGDDVLTELPGVNILIEGVDEDEDAKMIGLTTRDIRRTTELVLRQSRIPVLTDDQMLLVPGMPKLYVNVNVLRTAFSVDVALHEWVTLDRRDAKCVGSTWESGSTGTHRGDPAGGDYLLRSVRRHIETFAIAWLKQNAKEK